MPACIGLGWVSGVPTRRMQVSGLVVIVLFYALEVGRVLGLVGSLCVFLVLFRRQIGEPAPYLFMAVLGQ